MPNSFTVNGSFKLLLGIVAMSTLAIIGIVVVVIFAPGEQQAGLITSVLSVTVPVVAMLGIMLKLQETARLADQAARTAERTAEIAERAAAHAKANAEQTKVVQNEVKSLSIQVDGRLTQLVKSLEAQAVLREVVGHGQGLVEGHAAGVAEADALTAARAEVPPAAPVVVVLPEPEP